MSAEPLEMVAADVRDVVHRVVEVDGIAALAAALHGDVVDAAQAQREGKEVGALEAEVGGVVGAERGAGGDQLLRVRVGLHERHEPREDPALVLAVPLRTLLEREIPARPALAVERRRAVQLHLARVEEAAERLDHAAILPVVRLALLRREHDHGAAVVPVGEHGAAVELDRAPIHETASIRAGRFGSKASRQHVQVCPSRISASHAA